ncbi:MAG: aminoacyl-tRNA hydrolase [Phycisphaerae bacterium]|nr:aminoacyl-tRNA hydrolase [Phycisphaerae bacterium]
MANDSEPANSVALGHGLVIPSHLLRFAFARASGPGGQNVNKRSTKAELRVDLADLPIPRAARDRLARAAGHLVVGGSTLIIECDEHRSQSRNRDACIRRLRELTLASLPPPKPRRKSRPTRSSVERRLEGKRVRARVKRLRREDQD